MLSVQFLVLNYFSWYLYAKPIPLNGVWNIQTKVITLSHSGQTLSERDLACSLHCLALVLCTAIIMEDYLHWRFSSFPLGEKNFVQHKGSLRWQEEIGCMLTPLLAAEQSLTSPDTAGGLVRGSYLFHCVEHIVFRKGGESALYWTGVTGQRSHQAAVTGVCWYSWLFSKRLCWAYLFF